MLKNNLIIIIIVLLFLGFVLLIANNEKDYSNIDIYEILNEAVNIENIYLERYSYFEGEKDESLDMQFYKKGNIVKRASNTNVSIVNYDENTVILYNPETEEGLKTNNDTMNLQLYYDATVESIIKNKDEYEYNILKDNINEDSCLKVTVLNKITNKIFYVLWIDLSNNMIIKTQEGENEKNYTIYTNINLDSVKDENFIVPNNIKIREMY